MRRFVLFALVAVLSLAFYGSGRASFLTTANATPVEVTIPLVRIVVSEIQDPYGGMITAPAKTDPALRYIGVDIGVYNDGDFPLAFSPSALRLRDDQGFDYTGGSVVGTDARLLPRTLLAGEFAVGWVWFGVPRAAVLTQLVYIPSATELRLPLDEAPVTTGVPITPTVASTPVPTATPTIAAPASPSPELGTPSDGTG